MSLQVLSERRDLNNQVVHVKYKTPAGHVATASLSYLDVSRRGLQVVLAEAAQNYDAQVGEDRDS